MRSTYLASHVPHGDRVVVGGVGSGARRVDPTEFVHIVVHVCSSCEQTFKKTLHLHAWGVSGIHHLCR